MRIFWLCVALALTGCDDATDKADEVEDCATDLIQTFADADGDGYGDDATLEETCGTDGRTEQGGDCDDGNPDINPGFGEACDGFDNNCNGTIDEGLATNTYYADTDGDGFGDRNTPEDACIAPPDYVEDDTDCDDTDATINRDGLEICDGLDNDCDQLIDDADPDADEATMLEWYRDNDGDGFGGGNMQIRCDGGTGSTNDGSDCDDANPDVNPNAQEICSGVDEDCDGLIDDADPDVDPLTFTDWFFDGDGDGLGVIIPSVAACEAPTGYVENADDCDDTDPLAGLLTDWYVDNDADGVGDGISVSYGCQPPYPGTAPALLGIDCDDNDPDLFPGNVEICGDGIDQDCSGADLACGPIGSFQILDGPQWTNNPPVYNCLEACAFIFGGIAADYQCSTSALVVDNQAYVDGWGDSQYCTNPVAEDFSQEDPLNPGYNCGGGMCSYSAYVSDHQCQSTNYCWP